MWRKMKKKQGTNKLKKEERQRWRNMPTKRK
jgi:hypothetical protein